MMIKASIDNNNLSMIRIENKNCKRERSMKINITKNEGITHLFKHQQSFLKNFFKSKRFIVSFFLFQITFVSKYEF